jgi:hypothetical protein
MAYLVETHACLPPACRQAGQAGNSHEVINHPGWSRLSGMLISFKEQILIFMHYLTEVFSNISSSLDRRYSKLSI